jgi:hypothetical protein
MFFLWFIFDQIQIKINIFQLIPTELCQLCIFWLPIIKMIDILCLQLISETVQEYQVSHFNQSWNRSRLPPMLTKCFFYDLSLIRYRSRSISFNWFQLWVEKWYSTTSDYHFSFFKLFCDQMEMITFGKKKRWLIWQVTC